MKDDIWVGIALFIICILVFLDYKNFAEKWGDIEAIKTREFNKGYDTCKQHYFDLQDDVDRMMVNSYLKEAIISQIENDGSYRRGDKKRIRECNTSHELEQEVLGIIER